MEKFWAASFNDEERCFDQCSYASTTVYVSNLMFGHFVIWCCSSKPKAKRKGGPGGLNKLCGVSPELQVIVGQPTLPRTEVQAHPSLLFLKVCLLSSRSFHLYIFFSLNF